MNDTIDDVFKAAGSIGGALGTVWQFVAQIQKRFARVREIEERGGEPGLFFTLCYTVPQYAYSTGLILCACAGFVAFIGGLLKITAVVWAPSWLTAFFADYWMPLLGLTALLLILAGVNGLTWIPIGLVIWIPRRWVPLKQSAAWHNLLQFCKPLDQPKPLFIDSQGVNNLADKAVDRIVTPGAGAEDFAEMPNSLTADERANAALIGCLLEKEHGLREWPRRKWRPFYNAIAAAEMNGVRMVTPDYLQSTGSNTDFYGGLREEVNRRLPLGEPPLPESAVVMNDLSKAVQLLTARYKGSARNLALRWWSKQPNLRIAFDRAAEFYPLDEQSMVPQFLKLAVRWDVWPSIEVGNFVYPYATILAVLVLESHGLVTLGESKSFAFKDPGELSAFRETMRRTVKRVLTLLSESKKAEHRDYLQQISKAQHPIEWELAAEVDFALWSLSREMAKQSSFGEWKVDESRFVVRKSGGGLREVAGGK